jgi:CO dehydrogenase maturation factor
MTITIALAGKGGVGKTTIAMMVIKFLIQNRPGTVLAVDADPSSNLNMALGLDLDWTVGDIREDLLQQVKNSLQVGGAAMGSLAGGTTKREYLDYHIRSSLVEADRFDLIAMGRSEGPGCYCAVNHNLREVIDSISRNYQYVVIDNEAGMEHLSRRTTRDVQFLLIVTDPTLRGLRAAERIIKLKDEMDINIEKSYLIINRLQGDLPQLLQEEITHLPIPLLGVVPDDPKLESLELSGRPLIEIETTAASYQAMNHHLSSIL